MELPEEEKHLRITGQQRFVEAMLRLGCICYVRIPRGKVIN